MSVKKQIPSLCKLFPFYEGIPEEFLDKTDVNSFFYHNIFNMSQSPHRIARVSRGCNEKSFAIKLIRFCDLKTQQRYILQQDVNISKRELTSLVDSLRDSLKVFDHTSKCIQIPLPKPKADMDLKSQKTISLLITVTISLDIQIDTFVYRSELETTVFAYCPSKSLHYLAVSFFLLEIVNLSIREILHLYKNRYCVANKCEIVESNYDV